jgi:hypothetical protein
MPDATSVPALGSRGDRCGKTACADGLSCAPLPGGYCASSCGATQAACDGHCVDTARVGELCAKRCTSDADCRANEGYVCDPQWKACLVPNFAAIVPRQCPTTSPARDTAFGDSQSLSTAAAPGAYQLEPAAVLTDDGGLVALYMAGPQLGVSRVDSTGARTLDVPFATERTNHADPWLARDRKGTLYAVWLGFDAPQAQREIGFATSTDRGATWSTPVAVHDPTDCTEGARDCLEKPMVIVGTDPKTKREIVYVMYAAGEHGMRVRTSHDGGKTFTTGAIALAGTYGNAATTGDGRLHLVALHGNPLGAFGSAHHAVEYTVSSDGGASVRPPVRVSGTDEMLPFYFSNPSIAVDAQRRWIYVAYVRGGRDAAWDIVIAASKDGGTTWKRTKLAGDGCAIHMVPNLALDPATGTLHVAYYDSEGAAGRFVHASCGPGVAKCKVHGAINSLAFSTLSTARHSSKWLGEYEALLVDAKRRILHAVWAQTNDEAGRPVTRIFHAQAKLKK